MQSRITPHLICLVLLFALGTGAAVAREAVVVPVSCESREGRLVVYPTRPIPHEIVSERERQVFSVCHPGNANWCRPIMLYKFDVACGGERVPWRDLAAAVLASSGTQAWVDNDRLHITPPRRSRLGDCGAGDPALGFMKDCDPWELGDSHNHWVLPVGFAPVHEVGARFVPYSRADPPRPPVAHAPQDVETSAMRPAEPPNAREDTETAEAEIESDASPRVDEPKETVDIPPAPAPVRALRSEAGGAAPPANTNEPANPPRIISSPNFVQEVSAALAAAQAEERPRVEERQSSNAPPNESVSAQSWWSAASLMERYRPMLSWLWEQGAASVRPLAAQFKSLPLERNLAVTLMGLVLLSGLVSGIGLYSLRARRVRTTAYRPAGAGPGAAPQSRSSSVATSQFGTPVDQGSALAGAASSSTALVNPTDERMCGELCRTAHAMLQQIDARVDELQGVAPLRRVLQREMRHLEQFLTAVMTANPREPEEWRRMRNRLQRIVRELHRLRDIVEGAYRSLSVGGFTSREPPRDKYEAYELLGVNPDVSLRTLKKLVDALRACWHPDLAKDEADRLLREERMKRINIAWDLITSKRQEA